MSGKLLIKDKYRLELRWSDIYYHDDSTAILKNAVFSGPVLKDAVKLAAPDFIDLDLTPQHCQVLNSFYIIRLQWASAEYRSDGTISLGDAVLSSKFLKSFHQINNGDWIRIDTSKHEVDTHAYHLVYASEVVKKEGEVYRYRK